VTPAIQRAEAETAKDVKTVVQHAFREFGERQKHFEQRLEEKIQVQFEAVWKACATKAELAEVKAELIRWMFIFWVGQIAATVALVKFLR
jgi:hypothetical protein